MLLTHDISHAILRPAPARVVLVVINAIAIVIAELFTLLYVFDGDYPDMVVDVLSLAIRAAGMVDELGLVIRHVSVNIMLFVKLKDVYCPAAFLPAFFKRQVSPSVSFILADYLADILDYLGAFADVLRCEDSMVVDSGFLDFNHVASCQRGGL